MKKAVALVLVACMAAMMFAGCGNAKSDTIKVGMLGPYTGDAAKYGLSVRNGAQLYIDQVNAAGGVNGKQIEVIAYDNKGNDAEAVTAFTKLVDEGITALIGDVLTSNTIAVVGEAYPINMPMITASATAAAVTYNEATQTVYSNVFRTCFIDPFQGEKMAQYAAEVLGAKSAAVICLTGSDYSVGLADAFRAKCAELGVAVVADEGYSEGDMDFKSQLTNIAAAAPDVVFCPNYYEDDGLIVTQARAIGLNATFLGGDGWANIQAYGSAADLEGCLYCSAYAPGSSDAVKAFEKSYVETYGEETLTMFAALGYDAAMVLVAALEKAEATGEETGSDAYRQAVIDGIKSEGSSVKGVTSANGYTFDEYNNPVKDAVIMTVENGKEVFKQMY